MIEHIDELTSYFKNEWSFQHQSTNSKIASITSDDISDFYIGSKLSYIENETMMELSRSILLQVEETTDISMPFQQRVMMEYDHGKGTFKLLLSDGEQNFCGIISSVDSPITPHSLPGSKILIKKGIIIRFGVFLLHENDFIFIGGSSPKAIEKEKNILIFDKNARPIYHKMELKEIPKRSKRTKKQQEKPVKQQKAEKSKKKVEKDIQASKTENMTKERKKQQPAKLHDGDEESLGFLSSDSLTDPDGEISQDIFPLQSLNRTNEETKFVRNDIKKCTVSDLTALKVVKRGERLLFQISIVLGDGRSAEASEALAERLLGCSPEGFLSIPADARAAISESAMKTLFNGSFDLVENEKRIIIN